MAKFTTQVTKSPNFDKQFKTNGLNRDVNAALKKAGTLINGIARKKYVPVETGQLIKSLSASVSAGVLTLSSIDYPYDDGRTRYTLTNSSVPKNRSKYEWFDRAINDAEKKLDVIFKEVIDE